MVSYAKQFQDCLEKMDLSRVRDLRDSFRPNVLKALSALAKFSGCYEQYRQAMRGYGLKWGGRNSDDVVIDRFTKVKDSGEVWTWIRDVREAHASFMTKHLQQPEIDFIHGRVSTNVFMRNYFNPALIGDLKARALKGIQEMVR